MSKEDTRIAALESRISLPGCEIHRNGLQIAPDVTEDQLAQIGGTLRTINESGLWWWGDYLNFFELRRGISYAEAAKDTGYEEQTLRVAKMVCEKFPLLIRINNLSFTHHREAITICQGDVKKALKYLKQAEAEKWSISDLRAAIRTGEAIHKGGGSSDKGEEGPMNWIIRFKTWFKGEPSPKVAKAILPDLEATVARCREIASKA